MKKSTNKSKNKSKKQNKSVYEKVVVNECGTRSGALKHPPLYQMVDFSDENENVINGASS